MSQLSLPIGREALVSKLNDMDSVQPLSTGAMRLVHACQDPATKTSEVISIIESDPAIAARILAVANSPLYGYSRQICTIAHAVVILGIRNITQFAVSFAAKGMYCQAEGDKEFRQYLYLHSLSCALIARSLTSFEDRCDPEHAFLGGLLHDIGKLVFSQLCPGQYVDCINDVEDSTLLELEIEMFGMSHEEIGGVCARMWGFPEEIINVISKHHGSESAPLDTPLELVVEAADRLAQCGGIATSRANLELATFHHNRLLAGLQTKTRNEIVESAKQELETIIKAG